MSAKYYADVDMVVVDKTVRDSMKARRLTLEVLQHVGPAGGNPLVRISGTKGAIQVFLKDNDYQGVEIVRWYWSY